jgi:alkylation response protein AidB-like acyl-CoA dehydrogenase
MTPMGPEMIFSWMPAKSVEIHDTWHVSGLCGTGSFDISVRDVFVPDRHTFILGDPRGARPEPMGKLPPFGWFVTHVAAVSLGVARAALDEVVALAETRLPTFSTSPLADLSYAQVEIARAEAALGGARALLCESVAAAWRAAKSGVEATPREVAMLRVAGTNACEIAANVARAAGVLGGGNAIRTSSSLQRHVRDADALAHHFSVAPSVWADAGRVFCGRKPLAPMF